MKELGALYKTLDIFKQRFLLDILTGNKVG